MTEPESKPTEPAAPVTPSEQLKLNEKVLQNLHDAVVNLSLRLEQTNLAEFVDVTGKPLKLIRNNLIAGVARGVGMFLGAGMMGAITLALISWVVYHVIDQLNWIPVIGQFTHGVGDLVKQFLEQHPAKK
ncbi:MAG: DUF5665 domain-containing protein [Candidatus Coatesbacteria bacterium]